MCSIRNIYVIATPKLHLKLQTKSHINGLSEFSGVLLPMLEAIRFGVEIRAKFYFNHVSDFGRLK
jgi:hypothetical protein